ncbi:MAG: hypothetical protein H6767_08075 [Candidatus Peribacteria bacterium]|nr:MAG: hypothetical protein H6767_08075 [Candidatus Peribacteria bacterium]
MAKKRYATYSYKNLKDKTYEELAGLVGDNFIVKPINASSSTNTFKISSAEGFDGIKKKLSKNYEYIIEEYI